MDVECKQRWEELKQYPRMFDWVDRYTKEKPDTIALIEYNTSAEVSWKSFSDASKAFAAKLISMGVKKGDVVATTLPLLKEHVYLMYACFRVGAIIAPLDLRLKTREVDHCFRKMQPKVYFTLGKTEVADFRPILEAMIKNHSVKNGGCCEHFVQFQKEDDLVVDGAIGLSAFVKGIKWNYILNGILLGKVKKAEKKVTKRDPVLLIFTTGSTGSPKAALLCSENILLQNIGLVTAFEMKPTEKICVNLPLSHVGCTTEQLASIIYGGGTAVLLHIFDAEKTLDAIQKYNVNLLGQIPALFNMEWRLPNYDSYDLSSLRFAIYGGQAVSRKFLEKMATMAKYAGTGLGLTETAGFCSYTPIKGTIDEILASVGYEAVMCPISIRKPMKDDGTAGEEVPKGEVGEICFSGPQIFLGYMNDLEETKKTLSSEGILYTGDLGSYDENGLHFAGRKKFIIKPKGYNVFPTEIEDFLESSFKEQVERVAIVGAPHEIFSEGIIAFVELKEGASLKQEKIYLKLKELAAYKRPNHIEFVKSGDIPLNRVNKTDYMVLRERSLELIAELRKQKKWDMEEIPHVSESDFNDFDSEHPVGKVPKKYDL